MAYTPWEDNNNNSEEGNHDSWREQGLVCRGLSSTVP